MPGFSNELLIQNPVHDVLNLKGINAYFTKVYITDTRGRFIASIPVNENNHEFNLQWLNNGMYFIHLQNAKTMQSHKFVKM